VPSLPPWTRRILIAWFAIWFLNFLITPLGGRGVLNEAFALDLPTLLGGAEGLLDWLGSLIGALGAYTLLHDQGGLLHVAFNALLFYHFAPSVEQLFPGRRFLRYLWIAALAGTAAEFLLWLFGARWAAIGGSGLVAAVIATNAAIYPRAVVSLIFLRVTMFQFFLILLALDLLRFLVMLKGGSTEVAFDVHLGGAAAGWLMGDGFGRRGIRMPWESLLAGWRARRAEHRRGQEMEEEKELDRILAKIGRQGLPSLTRAEKRFLERRAARRERRGDRSDSER